MQKIKTRSSGRSPGATVQGNGGIYREHTLDWGFRLGLRLENAGKAARTKLRDIWRKHNEPLFTY